MIAQKDFVFTGIPFARGGRTRAGLDCAGLALLFLKEEMGLQVSCKASTKAGSCAKFLEPITHGMELERGDVVFFEKDGKPCHVATHLGGNRWLEILQGCESRIVNGWKLMERLKLKPCGVVRSKDAEKVCAALNDPGLGAAAVPALIGLVLGLILSFAASLLAPKLPRFGAKYGRYSPDALVTQTSPELPLPDLLGQVTVAGNSVYRQLGAKGESYTATSQRWCQLIILGSGPVSEFDLMNVRVNGLTWADKFWKNGSNIDGIALNPAQTEAEAVTGTIAGDTSVPSLSLYTGEHGITVPVDVRAQYDRDFPVYGLAGCAYVAGRLMDATKFSTTNLTVRVKSRLCRTFDASGFDVTTASGESLSGADGTKVRFKLAHEDVVAVSSVTVNATSHTEMSATNQSGNVFSVNKTKGYIEFITAPAAAATILITYTYYPREWSRNPAMHLVYLLTEPVRGKGFDESRVDWAAAVELRDHCDEVIDWNGASGPVSEERWVCDYAIDFRKPIQEHMQAVLDSCRALMFVSNGVFVMRAREDSASVFSFTQSNIIAGSFASELLPRAQRPNRVRVSFNADDNLNAETEASADDQADQDARAERVGNRGVIEEQLKVPSITGVAQAERIAESYLRESVGGRWSVEFTTNVQGLALQPGDVVDVTHSSQPRWDEKTFRIDELEHDDEDRLVIRASEHVGSAFF